jgi:hypothetical protein
MATNHKKTPCPVTRPEFRQHARPWQLTLEAPDGTKYVKTLDVKEFSTGSMGWFISENISGIKLSDKEVKAHLGINFTIANSKEVPKDALSPTS